MNTPLRFPTVDSQGVSSAQAASDLAGLWRDDLALGAAECDEPGFELLERAAHGELDADEAELLALRTEWDENLARELADLQALAGELRPQRTVRTMRNFLASRTARFAGLAAMLLLVAGALGRLDRRDRLESPTIASSSAHRSSAAPEASTPPLFRDGFESGSAASWAN